jgi:hypothetical protein
MVESEKSKVTSIQKLIRYIISLFLFVVIIFVWSYYLILSAIPYVRASEGTQNPIYNPMELFCGRHDGQGVLDVLRSIGAGVSEIVVGDDVANDLFDIEVEEDGEQNYCVSENKTTYICGDNDSAGICLSDYAFIEDNYWCDDNEGLTGGALNDALRTHCCEPIDFNSNINYMGLVIYLVVTAPIVFLLIQKIFEVFIRYDKFKRTEYSSQYYDYFSFISKRFSKYLAIFLILYYMILPMFRFFFVSISCDNTEFSRNSICEARCNQDDDCVSLHGECSSCINGLCRDPNFVDEDSMINVRDIDLRVCVPGGNTPPNIMYGQPIIFEDTSRPFSSQFLEPIGNESMHGFVPVTPVTGVASACENNQSKTSCNLNIDCEWTSGSCGQFCQSGNLYDVGTLSGELIIQDTDTNLNVTNRVYSDGVAEGENLFPCSDTVIPSYIRNTLSTLLDESVTVSSISNQAGLSDSINEYELNRIECAEYNGACYMDQYPCQTNTGEPIPLKYLDSGLQDLTIGSFTQGGCSKAMYPCDIENGSECIALTQDDSGNLIEGEGVCTQVEWSTNTWVSSSDSGEYKCLPEGVTLGNETIENSEYTSDVTQSQCTSLERYPQELYQGPALFRWSPTTEDGEQLCETYTAADTLCESDQVLATGLYFYNESDQINTIKEKCCFQNPISDNTHDVALTGESVETQNINGVNPITIN